MVIRQPSYCGGGVNLSEVEGVPLWLTCQLAKTFQGQLPIRFSLYLRHCQNTEAIVRS